MHGEVIWGRKQTRHWTTKDKRKIRICDMEDSHLLFAQRMVMRVAQQQKFAIEANPPHFQGEMAQMHADNEYNAVCNQSLEEFAYGCWPIVEALDAEIDRRGLKPLSLQ